MEKSILGRKYPKKICSGSPNLVELFQAVKSLK